MRERVALPIVGLIKREYSGFEPYITPTLAEVASVVESGAEIVAFDATPRARPGGVATVSDSSRRFMPPAGSRWPIARRRRRRGRVRGGCRRR